LPGTAAARPVARSSLVGQTAVRMDYVAPEGG